MLGKTNINTLTEGTIVTEIKDYKWIQMQSGIFSDFIKAIYKNNYLAAITADGKVVYTTDGEVWQVSVLEYKNCKLHDIDFDGSKFIIVGNYMGTRSYSDETTGESQVGLILVTSDFTSYEKKEIVDADGTHKQDFLAVCFRNGKYIFWVYDRSWSGSTEIWVSDLSDNSYEQKITPQEMPTILDTCSTAKNSQYMILAGGCGNSNSYSYYTNLVKTDAVAVSILSNKTGDSKNNKTKRINVFECKDILYYISLVKLDNYDFFRILSSGEKELISSDINYMFVDGVYFNECQIFINAHEMLVVKKGENVADKTLDDLIEVAPEHTMNCITKAFGQLYIFGNQGVILKSSVETNNEQAIVIQTLSAKKALVEAKKYADERYAALDARIAALEELKGV
ncbi:MAG: hypothetical protein K2N80_05085 [Lachnospiraceae bacterium]|nr:hypothetical protein [Lachnospiraceae bacterium]